MLEPTDKNIERFRKQAHYAWVRETAKDTEKWDPLAPWVYQDDVTALVFQDLFGGEIFVTTVVDEEDNKRRVYFNVLDGKIYDMTDQIYPLTNSYMKVHRDGILALCLSRYEIMRSRVFVEIKRSYDGRHITRLLEFLDDHGYIDRLNPAVLQIKEIYFSDQVEGVYEIEGDGGCTE